MKWREYEVRSAAKALGSLCVKLIKELSPEYEEGLWSCWQPLPGPEEDERDEKAHWWNALSSKSSLLICDPDGTTEHTPPGAMVVRRPYWGVYGEVNVSVITALGSGFIQTEEPVPFVSALWGKAGPSSKLPVPWAEVEKAFSCSDVVVFIANRRHMENYRTSAPKSSIYMQPVVKLAAPAWDLEAHVYKRDFNVLSAVPISVLVHIWQDLEIERYEHYIRSSQDIKALLKSGFKKRSLEDIRIETPKIYNVIGVPEIKEVPRITLEAKEQSFVFKGHGPFKAMMKELEDGHGVVEVTTQSPYTPSALEWRMRYRNVVLGTDHMSEMRVVEDDDASKRLGAIAQSMSELSGVRVEVSQTARNRCMSLTKGFRRNAVPYERQVMIEGDNGESVWNELYREGGVRSTEVYKSMSSQFERNVPERLKGWPFQNDDVIRAMCHDDCIYAAQQGLGKTRFILMYCYARGGKRNLVVLEPGLVQEFLNQAQGLGLSRDIHVIESPEDLEFSRLKRLNIITYTRLWRAYKPRFRKRKELRYKVVFRDKETIYKKKVPKKWEDFVTDTWEVEVDGPPSVSYAHVLRRYQFNSILADEAHKLAAGKSTNQGEAMFLLRCKHFVSTTGTVVRSYVRQLYPLLCRTLGEHTITNEWGYRSVAKSPEGQGVMASTRKFSSLFITAQSKSEDFESNLQGVRSKERPHVSAVSLPLWHDMTSKAIIRRRRIEPGVAEHVRVPDGETLDVQSNITKEHGAFYKWWLESFADWFEKALEGERRDQIPVNSAEVLVQLTKLRLVATLPQSSSVNIPGVIEYSGGPTAKQLKLLEMVKAQTEEGQKVIVFTEHPELVQYLSNLFMDHDLGVVSIYGAVPIDERYRRMRTFKTDDDVSVLLATRGVAAKGFNLPEGDCVHSADFCWTPAEMEQAEARVLRPDWLTADRVMSGRKPMLYRHVLRGSIDEYMRQLVLAKADGYQQAIDHEKGSLEGQEWLSVREFAQRMLEDLGLL